MAVGQDPLTGSQSPPASLQAATDQLSRPASDLKACEQTPGLREEEELRVSSEAGSDHKASGQIPDLREDSKLRSGSPSGRMVSEQTPESAHESKHQQAHADSHPQLPGINDTTTQSLLSLQDKSLRADSEQQLPASPSQASGPAMPSEAWQAAFDVMVRMCNDCNISRNAVDSSSPATHTDESSHDSLPALVCAEEPVSSDQDANSPSTAEQHPASNGSLTAARTSPAYLAVPRQPAGGSPSAEFATGLDQAKAEQPSPGLSSPQQAQGGWMMDDLDTMHTPKDGNSEGKTPTCSSAPTQVCASASGTKSPSNESSRMILGDRGCGAGMDGAVGNDKGLEHSDDGDDVDIEVVNSSSAAKSESSNDDGSPQSHSMQRETESEMLSPTCLRHKSRKTMLSASAAASTQQSMAELPCVARKRMRSMCPEGSASRVPPKVSTDEVIDLT